MKMLSALVGLLRVDFEQLFTTRKIANALLRDPVFLGALDLYPVPALPRRTLRFLIGFVLAMYRTFKGICGVYSDRSPDERWARLILSRTRMTVYGEKSINGAAERLSALKLDLISQGTSWDRLPTQDRFILVCSTVLAIESYEWPSGGLPTGVCTIMMAHLVPKVFEFVPWSVHGLD